MVKRALLASFFGLIVFYFALPQTCPTVCVIIPETVIIERVPRPIPDPASETAVIKQFLSYGFHVVDQAQVKFLRMTDPEIVERARNGDLAAIRMLSERFAAEVLVLGEAVSTVTVFEALQIPGRPRLQDGRARVEVRAIDAKTGRILAVEALHTGGIDFSAELAGKKSLERAGDKVACLLARAIAQNYPFPSRCFKDCPPPVPTFGALPFEIAVPVPVRGLDIGQLFATTTETALSERGCKTAQALAADYVVTGVITDWREIKTPAINIPVLDLLFRGIACWVTVDARVLDLATAEFKAYEVTVNVAGIEILGFRFGASPQDIARAVAKESAARLGERRGR
ncbi:MAG: hypothetical protein ACP5LJ_07845 [Candidatus Bipolaricaulaceae bacterium]